MHSSKRKGDAAEREAVALINELLADVLPAPAKRELGAGRADDVGDVHGVPDHAIQVAAWADVAAAARVKPPQAEQQAANANVPHASTFVRFRGGTWRVVLTPAQWALLTRRALRSPHPPSIS